MSQKAKVLNALMDGDRLTAKQIQSRFNARNPHEVVRQLRVEGYPIYLNRTVNSKGEVKNKYRLGTPSRRVVAAGYRAISAGVDGLL